MARWQRESMSYLFLPMKETDKKEGPREGKSRSNHVKKVKALEYLQL